MDFHIEESAHFCQQMSKVFSEDLGEEVGFTMFEKPEIGAPLTVRIFIEIEITNDKRSYANIANKIQDSWNKLRNVLTLELE